MRIIYTFMLGFIFLNLISAQSHPNLLLTKEGVVTIKTNEKPALYQKALSDAILSFKEILDEPMQFPVPKDMAGGHSHEVHKSNYGNMQSAGLLFQVTDEVKYKNYVLSMLLGYADLFKVIDKHPSTKSYSPGKLFWQCLNDANWLLYSSQAYDAIYESISEVDRKRIENEVFRPYADFISIKNPKFFNRIHNHSTWGNAAVGMVGLALNDEELISRALYGLKISETDKLAKDNDGGFIYENGAAKAGFFAQIDYAFSPDGYYEEGPYYHRYAMLPFMVFAQALNHHKPELKIFEYRGGLLIKAVKTLLAQTSSNGEFFPLNDAQKGMSISAGSVITAVDLAYSIKKDESFLLAANVQNNVLLDQTGFQIAADIEKTDFNQIERKSVELKDGHNGDKGALGILRSGIGNDEFDVVFKYTSQGLGHGHYDKLGYVIYDGSTEVIQDYGAARWVNIDQKGGGRYLEENKTWSKQTIAHNTLVVDESSHFQGRYEEAQKGFSTPVYFNTSNKNLQIISAKDTMAYDDTKMQRVIALWKDSSFPKPLVIDLFVASSESEHTYELPFQYAGQLLQTNFKYKTNIPSVLGDNHGYEHVYKEGGAILDRSSYRFNWLKDKKFYTLISASNKGDEIQLLRIGANDPEFNLRRDPFISHKKAKAKDAIYLSIIESHGVYSTVTEVPINPYGIIESIDIIYQDEEYVVFDIISTTEKQWRAAIAINNGSDKATHQVKIDNNQELNWQGPIIIELK